MYFGLEGYNGCKMHCFNSKTWPLLTFLNIIIVFLFLFNRFKIKEPKIVCHFSNCMAVFFVFMFLIWLYSIVKVLCCSQVCLVSFPTSLSARFLSKSVLCLVVSLLYCAHIPPSSCRVIKQQRAFGE